VTRRGRENREVENWEEDSKGIATDEGFRWLVS